MRESHFFFAREKVPLKLSEVGKKTRRLSLTNAFIPAAHATQRRFAVMRKMALISRVKKYEGERSSSAFLGLAGTPHPSQPKSHPYIHPSKISAFSFIINRSKSPILVHFDGNSCRKLIGFGAEFSASINCTRLHEFLLVKSHIIAAAENHLFFSLTRDYRSEHFSKSTELACEVTGSNVGMNNLEASRVSAVIDNSLKELR